MPVVNPASDQPLSDESFDEHVLHVPVFNALEQNVVASSRLEIAVSKAQIVWISYPFFVSFPE